MKTYTLSGARAGDPKEHAKPECTATRQASTAPMDFDRVCKVWPCRKALAVTIRMQEKRAPSSFDWRPVVRLSDGEGY